MNEMVWALIRMESVSYGLIIIEEVRLFGFFQWDFFKLVCETGDEQCRMVANVVLMPYLSDIHNDLKPNIQFCYQYKP
jgi:hypothetical protein